MKKSFSLLAITVGIIAILASTVSAKSPLAKDTVGAVYTMTNDPTNNEIVYFDRDANGILTKVGSVPTGGRGSGGGLDPLASQGSLTLTGDGRWLLSVNAGSNEISVFRVSPRGLDLADKVDSGGEFPVSVGVFHDLVYVLNAGANPNVTGFFLSHMGQLIPLADSTRLLGSAAFANAQVGFNPQGTKVVVTDKAASEILVFSVDRAGLLSASSVVSPSDGPTPFGFIFDERGHLLVVQVGDNAVSSYDLLRDGTLSVISPSVANGQVAACWITANERGNVFTANPGTNSISAYKLRAGSGTIALVEGVAGTGNAPLDLSASVDGRFLYAVDPAAGGIDMFLIESDGEITSLGTVDGGLSIFAQGIAAR
jgi:6-phosphogluconolactonase